ncbi:MAG: ComEC/Rec2 family competence protein [Pseudomonadota bacterium]
MPIRSSLLLLGMMLAIWMPGELHIAVSRVVMVAVALSLCRAPSRPVVFAGLGFFLAGHAASRVQLQQQACDERVLAAAQVLSIPQRQGTGWQFDAQLQFPRQPQRPPVRARVTSSESPAQRPHAGEHWTLALQLRSVQPAAADAAQHVLLRDGVGVEARMLKSALNQRVAPARHSLAALRESIASRIDQRVVDPAAAALLAALAVGATGDVSRQQWRVFNATGITHLVAISGMHVTFFAMLSMAGARRMWAWIPAIAGRVRRESFAAAIGVLLATAYALLSGFSVPAQRTLLMLVAFLCTRHCARASGALWSVAVALVAVLLYDPLAVLSAGFWLSFAAVASIILVSGAQLGASGTLRSAASVQVVVTVALLPVTLLIFGTFSTAGVLVNALAIPAFTFLLVPPVLLATLGYMIPTAASHFLANWLLDIAAWVAAGGWPWLAQVADVGAALLHATAPASWYLVSFPAVALVVMPWGAPLRMLGCGVLLSVLLMRSPGPRPGEAWVDVLDVGAATAIIISTTDHRLVYGTGETFGSRGQRFENRIARRLQARGGNHGIGVLYIGATSADQMRAVLAADALLDMGMVVRDPGRAGPPEIAECARRSWRWDAVTFEMAPTSSGKFCSLAVTASVARMNLSPEVQEAQPADLLLVPGNTSGVQVPLIRLGLREGGFAVTSIDLRQWQAGRWRELARMFAKAGVNVRATAVEGAMHFEIGRERSPRIRMLSVNGLRAGIWSRQTRANSCAVGL